MSNQAVPYGQLNDEGDGRRALPSKTVQAWLQWHEASKKVSTAIAQAGGRRAPKLRGGLVPRLAGMKKVKVKGPASTPSTRVQLSESPRIGFVADYTVEFDGGMGPKCGQGYGSFKIGVLPVQRIDLGMEHEAHSAEIATAVWCLKALVVHVRQMGGNPQELSVLVRGDSKDAIYWINSPKRKMPKKMIERYRTAVSDLSVVSAMFREVQGEWRSRAHSVLLFGH